MSSQVTGTHENIFLENAFQKKMYCGHLNIEHSLFSQPILACSKCFAFCVLDRKKSSYVDKLQGGNLNVATSSYLPPFVFYFSTS